MDAMLIDNGSVCVLIPLSARARAWIDAHVDYDGMAWGRGIAIERRYVSDILGGLDAEGMTFSIH